jgi:hypothetical protein
VRVRRLLDRFELLDVVGHHQAGDRPLGLGDSERPVDQVPRLRGVGEHVHVLVGHVLVQRGEVHLLLVVAPQRGQGLLADYRHHGHVVHLGIVETVQQVYRPRPRGRQAHPDLAGELGVGASHERSHLLVPHLDQLGVVPGPVQSAHDAGDAVPRVAEDPLHPPLRESLHQEIADGLAHEVFSFLGSSSRWGLLALLPLSARGASSSSYQGLFRYARHPKPRLATEDQRTMLAPWYFAAFRLQMMEK